MTTERYIPDIMKRLLKTQMPCLCSFHIQARFCFLLLLSLPHIVSGNKHNGSPTLCKHSTKGRKIKICEAWGSHQYLQYTVEMHCRLWWVSLVSILIILSTSHYYTTNIFHFEDKKRMNSKHHHLYDRNHYVKFSYV